MLGSTEKTFARNEEEWQRSILASGGMVAMGTAAFVMGLYRSWESQSIFWMLILSGFALASLGGYLLFRLRPRLHSIEICEEGLRINERDGTSDFKWSDIRYIEESTLQQGSLVVEQVFIKRADELGFVANSLGISQFDDFLTRLREIATDRGIGIRKA